MNANTLRTVCPDCGSRTFKDWGPGRHNVYVICSTCNRLIDIRSLQHRRTKLALALGLAALVLFALATLGGCSRMVKPGATAEQAARDEQECNAAGAQYAFQMGAPGNPIIALVGKQECAKARGYVAE